MKQFAIYILSVLLTTFALACKKEEPPGRAIPATEPPPVPAKAPTSTQAGDKTKEKDEERAQAEATSSLAIRINGKPAGEWTITQLKALKSAQQEGDAMRWSLREIVREVVGPNARAVAVVAPGNRLEVDGKAWDDPARQPILRVNRKGEYKFQWSGGGDSLANMSELRQLNGIEIESK